MSRFVTGKVHYTQFAQVKATDKADLLRTRTCTSMPTLLLPPHLMQRYSSINKDSFARSYA